jgi:hypothetical protein
MGFNKRKMASERAAGREAESRRALGPQIVEDAKCPLAEWTERPSKHMPLLFSPTLEVAILTRHCSATSGVGCQAEAAGAVSR